jgi:hypothetical protein
MLINRLKSKTIPEHIFSLGLSLKAIGLYCFLHSLGNSKTFSLKLMLPLFKEKYDAVRGGIKELEDNGLLIKTHLKDNRGKIKDWIWILNPTPEDIKKSKKEER